MLKEHNNILVGIHSAMNSLSNLTGELSECTDPDSEGGAELSSRELTTLLILSISLEKSVGELNNKIDDILKKTWRDMVGIPLRVGNFYNSSNYVDQGFELISPFDPKNECIRNVKSGEILKGNVFISKYEDKRTVELIRCDQP